MERERCPGVPWSDLFGHELMAPAVCVASAGKATRAFDMREASILSRGPDRSNEPKAGLGGQANANPKHYLASAWKCMRATNSRGPKPKRLRTIRRVRSRL